MVSAKKFKVPKALAACADLLYTTRQERLELQKQVDELAKRETELKEHLIQELPKGEASGIAGHVARVAVLTKVRPEVQVDQGGWEKVHEYIFRTGAWELLARRLNDKAVAERWDAGEEVPGVVAQQYPFVSVSKV